MRGEVAVTGIGVVCGFGRGVDRFWGGLCAGEVAIGPFAAFDHARHRSHLAAEVPRAVSDAPVPGTISRADRFAVLAALEAIATAGVDVPAARTGVFFGSSTGGLPESEAFHAALRGAGGRARLRMVASQSNDGPGNAVARAAGVHGPVETFSSACTSGGLALAAALRALRAGEVDVALAGGADALAEVTYAGFNSLRSVDPRPCRPFAADRAGMSLGEGAAVLVLEHTELAKHRGMAPLALLAGAAATCDASHMSAPHPEGQGIATAIERALADAGVGADDVDFVNVHGTGTPHNDRAEWAAMQAVFGTRAARLPVNATKALLGHLLGSCGALEAAATVLCLKERTLHPVPAAGPLDPELGIDLVVGRARPLDARVALSTNLAFGGTNTALVFRRAADRPR